MKILKQSILAGAFIFAGLVSAQEKRVGMKNMLKVGAHAGVVLPSENTSATAGLDVSYQHLVTPSFGLGVATGYTHYFAQDNEGLKNNSVGVIPLAALVRYYPKNTGFYLGTDIGYGFLTGDDKIASNNIKERPSGGLYVRPQVGYHNRDWNFYVHYQKTFTDEEYNIGKQDYNVGSLGLGVAYNIPLGN